jgi:peptide/nickel transport system ATP-binding protein
VSDTYPPQTEPADPVLAVEGLTTEFATPAGVVTAIEDVGFSLQPGETLGIVGESGSGKSVTALTAMRLLDDNGRRAAGSVRLNGRDITALSEEEMSSVRGSEMAMVFQDPMTSLTPVVTVGKQLVETIEHHLDLSGSAARQRALELLETVRLPDPQAAFESYPHELSGGQRQRVLIAIAVSCDPDVLIADEPTTALDVTIEAGVLDLLEELAEKRGMSIVQITHDLGVVAETADRVAVMYAGRVVETGAVENVFRAPRHPYTAGLLRSTPRIEDVEPELMAGTVPEPSDRPAGCNFAPRCPHAVEDCRAEEPPLAPVGAGDRFAACIRTDDIGALSPDPETGSAGGPEPDRSGEPVVAGEALERRYRSAGSLVERLLPGGEPPLRALDGVDIELRRGETLGLVGESGSGKTTLGRLLVALEEPTGGELYFDGEPLSTVPEADLRGRVQFVFQDPGSSLNPRQTVETILGHAVSHHGAHDGSVEARVESLLEEVGLGPETAGRYPHELSGGQKQRVGIARALAPRPDVLIADEPTSALDVSVQGQILALLDRIRAERELSMLFISHDLSVVRAVASRVAVMYLGRIVEVRDTDRLFEEPLHPYTEALLSAVPELDPGADRDRILLEGELPDPRDPPAGCNFASRCPKAFEECHAADPALADVGEGSVACLLHSDATRGGDRSGD